MRPSAVYGIIKSQRTLYLRWSKFIMTKFQLKQRRMYSVQKKDKYQYIETRDSPADLEETVFIQICDLVILEVST